MRNRTSEIDIELDYLSESYRFLFECCQHVDGDLYKTKLRTLQKTVEKLYHRHENNELIWELFQTEKLDQKSDLQQPHTECSTYTNRNPLQS